MPANLGDVEEFLLELGRRCERSEGEDRESTLLVTASNGTFVAMRVISPNLTIRLVIGDVPEGDAHELNLYKRLLELNATGLMHSAYGLEDGRIVLTAALALENLDANEVGAVLSDVDLALARQSEEREGRATQSHQQSERSQVLTPEIIGRLSRLIGSKRIDRISSSEKAEKVRSQTVDEARQALEQAKLPVVVSIADERRLAKLAEQESANAAEWERKATAAITEGDDTRATEAVLRKEEHEALATAHKGEWQTQKSAVDELKTALRQLNDRLRAAQRTENFHLTRKNRAEALKSLQEKLRDLSDAHRRFDWMAHKIGVRNGAGSS